MSVRFSAGLLLFALSVSAFGGDRWRFGGHLKLNALYSAHPPDSAFRESLGSSSLDTAFEVRLTLGRDLGRWDFKLDYQLIALYADTLRLATSLPGSPLRTRGIVDDKRRWWDLTHSRRHGRDFALINRLDRLSVGFTTSRSAWRLGRQAISWGNGMVYTPMDIFNPFDPAAVDKEYKSGDDMLYGQWLFSGGDDLQGVAVLRRDPATRRVEQDQSSLALKYHGFAGMNEFDLLIAEHYSQRVLGVGGILNLEGSVLRGDLVFTDSDGDSFLSWVTSLSYSWTWAGKNVSGLIEYYRNGFGQPEGDYSASALEANTELLRRLERGELFSLGRDYLAGSLTIEMTPLFLLTPTVFVSLRDPSALAQLTLRYDWRQNLQLLAALNLPFGADGTEFGGIPAPGENRYFSSDAGLFAQLAWYF